MVFKTFWPWIPCLHRARSILEPASVLRRGLSAAFRVICSISYYLQHFVLFAAYCLELVFGSISGWLGCIWEIKGWKGWRTRMRRVRDQGIKRTQGPGDQGTRGPGGPEDQGTKRSGEPEIVFPVNLYFCSSIIPATTSLTRKIKGSPGIPGQGTCRDQGPRPWHSSPSRRRPSAADHHVLNRGP